MQSPFDSKNRLASILDRCAFLLGLFLMSIAYFFFLWRISFPSLLAGAGLFALLLLTLSLIEKRTLCRRNLMLRERVGGSIWLEELLLMPSSKANETVCRLLCQALESHAAAYDVMEYDGEAWLVRCIQLMNGSIAGAGDVLAAYRTQKEREIARCALCCTTGFSAEAVRAAEWLDPPLRLISGRQLASVAGKLHPATDEDIAARARKRKTPFSRARIRLLAFSPAKTKRYLLCAFLLLILYLSSGSLIALAFTITSFLLAILCHRENRKRFML